MRTLADFGCEATSVGEARDFVRAQLEALDEGLVECALLLTSELATNSVIHAKTPFSVSVERHDDHVRVEVGDHGDGGFQVQASQSGPGGHGLFVVREMATRSGFESRDAQHLAWFELELSAHADPERSLSVLVHRLGAARDVTELVTVALDGAIVLAHGDFGTLQLRDGSGSLRIAAHRGFGPAFLSHFAEVRVDDPSACGRALAGAAQVAIPDVSADHGFAPHREIAERSGFRAVQSTPLVHEGAVLGMLSTHYRAPTELTHAELTTLRRLADAVAQRLDDLGDAGAASHGTAGVARSAP